MTFDRNQESFKIAYITNDFYYYNDKSLILKMTLLPNIISLNSEISIGDMS